MARVQYYLEYWARNLTGDGTEVRTAFAKDNEHLNLHIKHCNDLHIPIHAATGRDRRIVIHPTMSLHSLDAYEAECRLSELEAKVAKRLLESK